MKQVIDLDNWNRKEHFAFFSAFDDPFFGVTTLVDFTDVYRQSKEQYLQPIITQYFIDNKSEIWLLFLIAHSKR